MECQESHLTIGKKITRERVMHRNSNRWRVWVLAGDAKKDIKYASLKYLALFYYPH